MAQETEEQLVNIEFNEEHFRVAIFGSARIEENDATYRMVYELAQRIGRAGYDIVTGGGPGIMEAANKGHEDGDAADTSHSLGLLINLPNEQKANGHLDIKQEYAYFTERLQAFMKLSNAVVVAPGGLGTFLELLYAWQLVQVDFIRDMPIILLGEMWEELVEWVEKWQLAYGYIDARDLDFVFFAKNIEEAQAIINEAAALHEKGDSDICHSLRKNRRSPAKHVT